MSTISYIRGEATGPKGDGPKVLAHVCNDLGRWGKGFVLALSRRWKEPEVEYRKWARGVLGIPFELGEVQFVEVSHPNPYLPNEGERLPAMRPKSVLLSTSRTEPFYGRTSMSGFFRTRWLR